jgi:autotransporter translocation and assembly factor TamB
LIRKIARFSRISLAALVLVGFVVLTVGAMFGEQLLRTQAERRISEALNRKVTVGGLSVNLPARVVELREVTVPGLPGSKRPSLVAPRVVLALSFRSLFTRRILLRGLELESPRISIQIFPDGSTDLPRPGGGGSSSRELSIGKLVVGKGELFLNEQRIPLEIDWPEFAATLAADNEGNPSRFQGDISAGPGPMRFGDLPAQDARFEVNVGLAHSTLSLDHGMLTTGATNLSFAGSLDLHDAPKGEVGVSGPFDLENFDHRIVATGLGLKGIAQTKGVVSVEPGKISLAATLRGDHGSYDTLPIDVFSAGLTWDGADLRLKDLVLDALGGKALLEVSVPERGPVKVAGTLEAVRAEPLLHWLFDYSSGGLGARVSGPIDLSLPRGAGNRLSGSGDLQFTGDPAEGEPLSGKFPFHATEGVITLPAVRLEAPKTTLNLVGEIQPDRQINLEARLLSDDLGATDALGARLRTAFGVKGAAALGAGGNGSFQGRVTGTLAEPIFTGGFSGTSVAYLGVSWGAIDWSGRASTVDLRSDRLLAVRGSSRVELSGTQRLGARGVDDAMDLTVNLKGWPAKDLLHVVESDLDVDASVTGSLRLLGTRSRPLGEGALSSPAGKASGIPFARSDLRLRFEGEITRVESLKAALGGGDLTVKGTLSEEAGLPAFNGDVELSEIEIADLGLQSADAPMVGGHITGRATLSGPLERPRLRAHLESKRVFYGDEGMGALVLEVEGKGDGVLTISGQSDSPRFHAEATGTIQAKTPYESRLEVRLINARVDPVLRALGSRFENAVVITASANARVEGPLAHPSLVIAQVREGRLRIAVPEYAIEAAPGAVIDIEKGEARIAGLTLTGEGTSLSVSGKLALDPGDTHDLTVMGRADLRVFGGFLREWRLRGSATLRSQIGGRPKALRLTGGLDIEDGAVRLRAFPQGLDGLNGRIVFNETQARLAGLEGRFGGGRVSVSGQVGFGSAVPASFDFNFIGDSLGLRYPEGLRATFGASLRLQGTAESHWLTGDLLVSKALWTRKYLITSELLGSSHPAGSFAGPAGLKPSPMHLDIAIKAPGTLRLDNNLASLVAKADLSLTGSPTEPQLLGRAELERGKVFFRGNTYEVRKGVANFSNPREINPVFDIEADTRVRSYRLTLQANGTLDRVSTRITSDPPLTSAQIASLLTGGNENDIANTAGSTDLKALGTGGDSLVSSVLDDALVGRVAQGFGLSRLSIDTGLFGRTGSRLTVGKRVTPDLEVIYSRQVSGGTEKLVTVEYSLSNRFSLVGSWQEPGGFGVDARTRFVLGRK